MKRSDWQYIVDTLLFICFIGIAIVGFLMGLVIPRGPQASKEAKYFLSLYRHQWGNIHFYLCISFVVLLIIHLILSWRWIKGKARHLFHRGWTTMLVLTVIVSLLVLFFFWNFSPKIPIAYEDYGVRTRSKAEEIVSEKSQSLQEEKISIGESRYNIVITGKTTLMDVEKATGIPAREMADALGLPSKASLKQTLGQLRKRYPFTMEKARDVLIELLNKKESLAQEKKEKEEIQIRKEQEIKIKMKEKPRPEESLREEHKQRLVKGRMAEVPSGILITGRMTLYDLEKITGIPARKIADELGIPPHAPLNEQLGRLRKRYFFTMQQVRDVVASLMKKRKEEKKIWQ